MIKVILPNSLMCRKREVSSDEEIKECYKLMKSLHPGDPYEHSQAGV